MSEAEGFKPIDIREIASGFGIKRAPGFLVRKFEKLLHIKELNAFVSDHYDEEPQQFLDNAVSWLDLHGDFKGPGFEFIKNNPKAQFLVASNHPIGGAESTVCLHKLHSMNPETRLLANSFYSLVKPMGKCCVYNKKDVRTLYDAVHGGNPILMYPAGVCSRKLSFKDVFDYQWKKGFVKMARNAGMPVVVCFVSGHASRRYLKWVRIRKFFHIKTVFEASYLPDEMFKKSGCTITFTFGHPIDPSVFTTDVSDQEWADRVRQYCYALKSNPDAVFDPALTATLPLS